MSKRPIEKPKTQLQPPATAGLLLSCLANDYPPDAPPIEFEQTYEAGAFSWLKHDLRISVKTEPKKYG